MYFLFKKANDRVIRDLLLWALEKKFVSTNYIKNYINIIKDIYNNVATNIRTIRSLPS